MVVGQQNANGIKSGLHDRSSSFSKITRHCFEQEMFGKQSRRGHATQLRCPLQAHSTLPILRQVVALARGNTRPKESAPMAQHPLPSIPHIGRHTFSVVSDSQSKQIAAVRDLCFDSASLRMAKSISQRFTAQSGRFQCGRFGFNVCAVPSITARNCAASLFSVLRDKFFSKRCDFLHQSLSSRCRGS